MASKEIPHVLIIGEAHPTDPRPHLKKIKNETIRKAVEILLNAAYRGRKKVYRGFDEEELARRWQRIIPLVMKIVQHAAKEGKKVIIHMEALPKGYKKSIVEAMVTKDTKHMTAAAHALIRLGDGIFWNHVIIRGLKDPKLEKKYKEPVIRIVERKKELEREAIVQALIDPKLAKKTLKEAEKLAKEFEKICKKWDKALKKEAVKGISEHPDDVHIFIVGEMHREELEKEIRKKFPEKKILSHALVSKKEVHSL